MEKNFNENVIAEGTLSLMQVFNQKFTENGDKAFTTSENTLLDVLFNTEYYRHRTGELPVLPKTEKNKLFSRFLRDPRYGMGARNIGRTLMLQQDCTPEEVAMSGRFDDVWIMFYGTPTFDKALAFLKNEILAGNEMAKKWMPRWPQKKAGKADLSPRQKAILQVVHKIANTWGLRKSQYQKLIRATSTPEYLLSTHRDDEIDFEKIPSLAAIKYSNTFRTRFQERYAAYLEKVNAGEAKLHVATSTPYDIYKNRDKIDPDVFFGQLPKISGSWIPVVDTSDSMHDNNDSFGKALSIGHYLAKCSSYAPDMVLSFSSRPQLIKLGEPGVLVDNDYHLRQQYKEFLGSGKSQYRREIASMYTGDWTNTDFGAVCSKLESLEKTPDWIIVLSDMEFDRGSSTSKSRMMQIFREKGMTNTKLLWWNFNSRAKTFPETDSYGNVFMSGYNPMLLQYLQAGFDGEKFLDILLEEYSKKLG